MTTKAMGFGESSVTLVLALFGIGMTLGAPAAAMTAGYLDRDPPPKSRVVAGGPRTSPREPTTSSAPETHSSPSGA